jgi:hypothetical protein
MLRRDEQYLPGPLPTTSLTRNFKSRLLNGLTSYDVASNISQAQALLWYLHDTARLYVPILLAVSPLSRDITRPLVSSTLGSFLNLVMITAHVEIRSAEVQAPKRLRLR